MYMKEISRSDVLWTYVKVTNIIALKTLKENLHLKKMYLIKLEI